MCPDHPRSDVTRNPYGRQRPEAREPSALGERRRRPAAEGRRAVEDQGQDRGRARSGGRRYRPIGGRGTELIVPNPIRPRHRRDTLRLTDAFVYYSAVRPIRSPAISTFPYFHPPARPPLSLCFIIFHFTKRLCFDRRPTAMRNISNCEKSDRTTAEKSPK